MHIKTLFGIGGREMETPDLKNTAVVVCALKLKKIKQKQYTITLGGQEDRLKSQTF